MLPANMGVWFHGGQMAHHPASLCTKLDLCSPGVLKPCSQEIKARWNLSEWSPALAHSSWGDDQDRGPPFPPWSLSDVGRVHRPTETHINTGANTYLLMFTRGAQTRSGWVLSVLWRCCLAAPLPYLLIYWQRWLRWQGHSLSESLPGSTTF